MTATFASLDFASLTSARTDSQLVTVKGYVAAGFITLVWLVGCIGGWSVTTDLAGAVLAPGTVVVASNVKKIQHPTGGVVGAILVKNGDHVMAGDVLVRLDETVSKANLQLITKQLDELAGQQARLTAERDDADRVTFPIDLRKRSNDAGVTAFWPVNRRCLKSGSRPGALSLVS